MPRRWIWLQLVIGWMPVWALYTLLMVSMHGTPLGWAAFVAFRAIATAALLGLVLQRLTRRLPWPDSFRIGFVAAHLVGAAAFAGAWLLLSSVVESVVRFGHGGTALLGKPFIVPFLILGVWLYVMVAGISYAQHATERAARAEALAAKSQLAALRGQLNPHFLFNALHTVVQLIPRQPREAARTAEQLATLLRTTIEEDRDLVALSEEWAFVERYLALERVRCGERLIVTNTIGGETGSAQVPSFALQTLVENAIRHGVAPRVEPTTVTIGARLDGAMLVVSVADTGQGADAAASATQGTGLRRLKERLAALYGSRARLDVVTAPDRGYTATLTIPQDGSPS